MKTWILRLRTTTSGEIVGCGMVRYAIQYNYGKKGSSERIGYIPSEKRCY